MELWTQARPLALTRRSLRYPAPYYDDERTAVALAPGVHITSGHVRDQNTLGPTAVRLHSRARLPLDGDRVDRLASGLSAATWACLVHDRPLADLSAARLFRLVVQVRRLRAANLHPGWVHRRKRRDRRHGCRYRLF